MPNTSDITDMYLVAKRTFYANAMIRLKSTDYATLQQLTDKLNEREWDALDFLQCQFKAFKYHRIFPSPKALLSDKSFARYAARLDRANRNKEKLYYEKGDLFFVTKTGKAYTISQVQAPLSQDTDASFASFVITENPDLPPKMWDCTLKCLEYYMAKLAFKGKDMPNNLAEQTLNYREKLQHAKDNE